MRQCMHTDSPLHNRRQRTTGFAEFRRLVRNYKGRIAMNTSTTMVKGLEDGSNGCALRYSLAPTITASEFARRSKEEEWVAVDARSEDERRVSIIPNALSIAEFEGQLEQHRKKRILVYCTVGCRSGAYAQVLRDSGFDAFSLWGGVLAWTFDKGQFVTPDGRSTESVHVSDAYWDVLPQGYKAVW